MRMKTKKIAFGGILLAVFTVLMYVDAVFPVLDRSFLLLSGLFVMTALIEYGAGYGVTFYVSSLIIGLLILPEKSGIVLFAAFFGLYPLIKFFIDKLTKRVLRIVLKLVAGNVLLVIVYCILKLFGFLELFVPESIEIASLTAGIVIALQFVYQIAVLIYDYFLTLFSRLYNSSLRKHFKGLVN